MVRSFVTRLSQRRYKILFSTSGKVVFLEVLLVQLAFTLLWPLLVNQDPLYTPLNDLNIESAYLIYWFFYGVGSSLWVTLRWRLRPKQRTRKRQFLHELVMAIILFIDLLLTLGLWVLLLDRLSFYTFLSGLQESFQSIGRFGLYSPLILMGAFLCSCGFLWLRMVAYILVLWNRLRRTRLRWALTHAHLMVVVIGAAIMSIGAVLTFLLSKNASLINALLTPVMTLFLITFTTMIGVAIVLPPSALFSYIFSRYMTRRIEHLVKATGGLRAGNYNARSVVEGEDEIARLQSDFNAMATDLQRTMSELQTERDNVATLLHSRRELIASVSHELRTPVATVRGYLESTLANWRDVPPGTLKQDLQVMEQQMVRMQALINDLFTLSRAEVGKLELRCQPTNVALLIQRVAETLAPLAWRGSRVEVTADIASIQPVFLYAFIDENRLEQVLQNLLHNSIRHTPPGGIIVLSGSADEQAVILQVKDTGEGIAQDELERIWERFYRAESTRNKPVNGSGLGLAIVKELTEAMGGSITVDSELSQGTCFTLRVPRVPTYQIKTQALSDSAIPLHLPL